MIILMYIMIAAFSLILGFLFALIFATLGVDEDRAFWVGIGIGTIFALGVILSGWPSREIARTEAANARSAKFRQDFADRCVLQHHGKLADLSGKYSRLNRVCISPDGRWLEWY